MIFHIGKHGWARVEIGENGSIFTGSASYLNDTPMDFLDAFKNFLTSDIIPTIKCDEEGSEFIIIVDDYTTYIISERDETRLFSYEINRKDFIRQVIDDIESQIDLAVKFMWDDKTENELLVRKQKMIKMIEEIRKELK